MYENNFNLMLNSYKGILSLHFNELSNAIDFDTFFGTTAGEEKTVTFSTPTVSQSILDSLFELFQKQKIFAIEGNYSQGVDTLGVNSARIVVINSNALELFSESDITEYTMYPPFYCTGILPNKNYTYGLQFNMVVDFDTTARNSITIKTKVYEPNSGGGNVEIPTITISSLSGTLSDSDYEKLVNSDMAKLVSPYGTFRAFKTTNPQQQNNLYYYVYETDENKTTCYSMIITNGTTKTYNVEVYTVGDFAPKTISIHMTSQTSGTMDFDEFINNVKLGVPICIDYYEFGSSTPKKIAALPFAYDTSGSSEMARMLEYETGNQILIARRGTTASVQIIKLYPSLLSENTFNEPQMFFAGFTAGSQNQLLISGDGSLSIVNNGGEIGLNGQGLMGRVGGSTIVLKMPTDGLSNNTEIVSKGYLDSRNYLKATNTTGALLTISNDNYIQLRSNIVNGGYFVVGNKTNTLPGFEVRDNSGNVVFDAKSKQGVVDIGTSTARMLFGNGITAESKVVKLFTTDNSILTFGLGNDRLSIDFNGRVLFDVQTTTISKDFNQVQSGEIAGRLNTGLTDEHIIITSIYDTTNQVEFMQPYFDGTEWRATAICVAQGISGTSNVQIKYIRLP